MDASQVTVVVPTLNEEKAIGRVIDELKANGFDDILVVDGHSKDRTREIAEEKGARVILQRGKGKADAIATVVDHINRPFVIIMDGDWTYPAYEIPRLLELMFINDQVIGARVKGRENIPLLNRLGNRIITFVFNMLFGTRLSDVCSGMYAVRLERLREVDFTTKNFGIEVEIAASVASMGGRVADVPIEYRKRIGKSKLDEGRLGSVGSGISIALDCFRLALRYNPMFLLFGLSSLMLIPGLVLGAWVGYELVIHGIKHYVWGIIASVFACTGLVSLMLAGLSLYLKRIEIRMRRFVKEVKELVQSTHMYKEE
mgnify:CR=1 FL=1